MKIKIQDTSFKLKKYSFPQPCIMSQYLNTSLFIESDKLHPPDVIRTTSWLNLWNVTKQRRSAQSHVSAFSLSHWSCLSLLLSEVGFLFIVLWSYTALPLMLDQSLMLKVGEEPITRKERTCFLSHLTEDQMRKINQWIKI